MSKTISRIVAVVLAVCLSTTAMSNDSQAMRQTLLRPNAWLMTHHSLLGSPFDEQALALLPIAQHPRVASAWLVRSLRRQRASAEDRPKASFLRQANGFLFWLLPLAAIVFISIAIIKHLRTTRNSTVTFDEKADQLQRWFNRRGGKPRWNDRIHMKHGVYRYTATRHYIRVGSLFYVPVDFYKKHQNELESFLPNIVVLSTLVRGADRLGFRYAENTLNAIVSLMDNPQLYQDQVGLNARCDDGVLVFTPLRLGAKKMLGIDPNKTPIALAHEMMALNQFIEGQFQFLNQEYKEVDPSAMEEVYFVIADEDIGHINAGDHWLKNLINVVPHVGFYLISGDHGNIQDDDLVLRWRHLVWFLNDLFPHVESLTAWWEKSSSERYGSVLASKNVRTYALPADMLQAQEQFFKPAKMMEGLTGVLPGTVRVSDIPPKTTRSWKDAMQAREILDTSLRIRQWPMTIEDLDTLNRALVWIEGPAQTLCRKILERGGIPQHSNAFGPAWKGVYWKDRQGIEYFTPLTLQDYLEWQSNHEPSAAALGKAA